MSNDPLIAALIDIASSARPALNAETLFSPFPRNRPLDPYLCESCQDATVERGDECDECKAELRRERAARADHARRTVEILKGKQS